MPALGKRSFKGESGTAYRFQLYAYGTRLRKRSGVFVVTNRTRRSEGGYDHDVLYVGQSEDLSRPFVDATHNDELVTLGANCICLLSDLSQESRLAKKRDLIASLHPLCNAN
jgi:hypothetical protein